jgi:hypothetical protein
MTIVVVAPKKEPRRSRVTIVTITVVIVTNVTIVTIADVSRVATSVDWQRLLIRKSLLPTSTRATRRSNWSNLSLNNSLLLSTRDLLCLHSNSSSPRPQITDLRRGYNKPLSVVVASVCCQRQNKRCNKRSGKLLHNLSPSLTPNYKRNVLLVFNI